MFVGLRNIAALEGSIVTRLTRFWLITFVLSGTFVVLFLQSCINKLTISPYSPNFGFHDPYYLFDNVDPLLFLLCQAAVALLAFDATHRNRNVRILEVLDSRPVRNFTFLAGRAISYSGCIWIVTVASFLLCQLIIGISNLTDWPLGRLIAFPAAANVLIFQLPLYLVFACTVTMFLSELVKSRFNCMVLLLGLLGLEFLFISGAIAVFLDGSNYAEIFARELTHIANVSQLITVLDGVSVVFVVFGIFFLTCRLTRRIDTLSRRALFHRASAYMGLGFSTLLVSSILVYFDQNVYQSVKSTHTSKPHEVHTRLERMTGEIDVDPGKFISIDLRYQISVVADTDSLVLSFNPDMQIQSIVVNGDIANFQFRDGLLVVPQPKPLRSGDTIDFTIKAHGKPNPSFAYLDASLRYEKSADVPPHIRQLYGTEPSVFDDDIAVLMPSIRWYPLPGKNNSHESFHLFELDILVKLQRDNWQVVGPGKHSPDMDDPRITRIAPKSRVPAFAIIAADFRVKHLTVGDYTMSLFLKDDHMGNLELFEDVVDYLANNLKEYLNRLSTWGLDYPFDSMNVVEVPHRLRWVAGGWNLPFIQSLPGVFLLRESGLPTASLYQLIRQIANDDLSKEQSTESKLAILNYYIFGGLGIGDWVAAQFWSNYIRASGDARVPIDFIFTYITHELLVGNSVPSSLYTKLSNSQFYGRSIPFSARAFSLANMDSSQRNRYFNVHQIVNSVEWDQVFRHPDIWNIASHKSLMELDYHNESELSTNLMLLKGWHISYGVVKSQSADKVGLLLASLLDAFQGTTFSMTDVYEIATQIGLETNPFFDEWMWGSRLPGILVSPLKTTRLPDHSDGIPQYRSSFHIRNDEDVTGLVSFVYGVKDPNAEVHWVQDIEALWLPGETSKQVNFVGQYPIFRVSIDTTLSQNVGGLYIDSLDQTEHPREENASFELFEASNWKPSTTGIVVDDLDRGFILTQRLPNLRAGTLTNLLSWFSRPRSSPRMDGNSYSRNFTPNQTPTEFWLRRTNPFAWGKYRRTSTYIYDPNPGVEATFLAQLPHLGRWKLEYFHPIRQEMLKYPRGTYSLRVVGESEPKVVLFDIKYAQSGWNTLGSFEIVDTETSVTLFKFVKEEGYNRVDVDAIRWTPITVNQAGSQ